MVKPTLPAGIDSGPLDAALLVASLRHVYRFTRVREKASDSSDVRTLCREIRLLVEGEIEDAALRRAAWEALRADLVAALMEALQEPARIAPPDASEPPP